MRCSKQALELLASHELDVVLTDINMPRLDGFGLIRKLRENALHGDRPILVLTNESSSDRKTLAEDAGANGWIVKPFDPHTITAALRPVSQYGFAIRASKERPSR